MPISLIDKMTAKDLQNIWESNSSEREHMQKRRDYYDGKQLISSRDETYAGGYPKSNIVTNWAKYIVNRYVGSLTNVPYQVSKKSDDIETTGPATYDTIVEENFLSQQDSENLQDALLYGRAIEVHEYVDGKIKIRNSDARHWVLIYDDNDDLAGALFRIKMSSGEIFKDKILTEDIDLMTFYDSVEIIDYMSIGSNAEWVKVGDPVVHHYDQIPIIVWQITRDQTTILTDALIKQMDEYNEIDSASGDDVKIGVDTLLKIKGVDGDWLADNAAIIHEKRIMPVPEDGDAEYMSKVIDVEPVITRLARTREHIHIMAEIPDMEQIVGATGTPSGIALRLKFLVMIHSAAFMATYLQQNMKDRIILINSRKGKSSQDQIEDVNIVIQFHLPINRTEEWGSIGSLSGIVSHRTQLELLTDITNPEKELERLESESNSQADMLMEQDIKRGVVGPLADQQADQAAGKASAAAKIGDTVASLQSNLSKKALAALKKSKTIEKITNK